MLVMVLCGQSVRLTLLALVFFGRVAAGYSGDAKRKPDTGPPPTTRIEVAPLGFVPPSRAYLNLRYSSITLDFIDNESLLFTFRDAGLIHRVPGDPVGDEDQVIRAMVLDIKTGKPVEETQWRMHDRQRYLWPLRDGRFIVRQRNALFLTDRRLGLRPYLQFDTPLQAVEVAPDRRLMVIEVQKIIAPDPEADKPASVDPIFGISPQQRRKRTQVFVLRPGETRILAETETRSSVDLPLLTDGFLSLLEGKDSGKWIIQKQTLHNNSETVAEFKSSCLPTLFPVSEAVTLAVGCPPKGGGDHMVSALSSSGEVLWQDKWKQRYIWPTFDYAEDGSRFAFGSLQLNRDMGFMDYFGADDVTAQMVGVFDTRSGKLQLVKDATPMISAGHNYALSRDGQRFAILREGAIEIYDLPPVSVNPVASSPPAADSALVK
ncbi:MAG: hypothetical protein JOZ83_02980 [Silvibacterium sp.]|nr:hypothetical protein [Silvibacterium sp.]